MAASTKNDVVIYDVEFFSGIIDVIEQYAEDINANTRGGINYVTESLKGDFEKKSFWDLGADLITDRDPTDITDAVVNGLSQSEIVSPKMNLSIGPRQATIDQFKKLGSTPEEMSFVLGTQIGVEMGVEWLNRALTAGAAVLTKSTDTHYDITANTGGEENISAKALNRTLGKLGDRRDRIVAWVMHSGAYDDLTEGYIVDKVDTLTSSIVMGGSSPTLGRNVLISDSPALYDADPAGDGTVDPQYIVLGLTEGALAMVESEDRTIELDTVLGKKNILRMLQGETAVNIRVKGWSFTGSASPDLAAVGTAANWTYVFNDAKSGAGVALTCTAK